jgi:hypothetical protein
MLLCTRVSTDTKAGVAWCALERDACGQPQEAALVVICRHMHVVFLVVVPGSLTSHARPTGRARAQIVEIWAFFLPGRGSADVSATPGASELSNECPHEKYPRGCRRVGALFRLLPRCFSHAEALQRGTRHVGHLLRSSHDRQPPHNACRSHLPSGGRPDRVCEYAQPERRRTIAFSFGQHHSQPAGIACRGLPRSVLSHHPE